MMRVRFLGTGPARGRPGRGRSRRTESSLLVSSGHDAILIDATRDFASQARLVDHLDLVLLTHSHRDATGGLRVLDRWLDAPTSLWSSRSTIRSVRRRSPDLAHLEPHGYASRAEHLWRGWQIASCPVPHARDCTTLAWRVAHGGSAIVYASDVARLTPAFAAFSAGCDLLVLDGAMWHRRIFTHLEVLATMPIVAQWPVGRVLLTQLGRSTPTHDRIDRWLHAIDPRIAAAYDGLEVVVKREPRTSVIRAPRARQT
jgi:ribonuclease BN (tRNA processing enzyme)